MEWHTGFRLGVGELRLHPGYRGQQYVDLGTEIAVDGVLGPRVLGPRVLGAERVGGHAPQAVKKVWRCVARFGVPSPGSAAGERVRWQGAVAGGVLEVVPSGRVAGRSGFGSAEGRARTSEVAVLVKRVVVGVDGSPESGAALSWAADDAKRRGVPLRVVYAEDPPASRWLGVDGQAGPGNENGAEGGSGDEPPYWPQMCTRTACAQAAELSPDLEIESEVVEEETVRALVAEGERAGELVIGSRALDRISRFVLGSVGLPVIGHATAPVVAVRAGGEQVDQGAPVVVAVDLHHAYDSALGFAFDAAAVRGARLRVLHAWSVRALYSYPSALPEPAVVEQTASGAQHALEQAVRPWQERFPEVTVEVETATGAVAPYVLDSSSDAALLVVGRRLRERHLPVPVGPVTHAVLHHAPCPVAVVPHH